jgi:predicted phosphodiesterase
VVGKSKVLEVVSYLIENGASKTCEAFNLTEETLNRYKREARKQFGEGLEAVVKLSEKLSIAEMNQLSSGSLHVPTGGKKHVIDFSGEEVTFGVMSDTHVGSIWTDPDHILKAFEEMKKQGCTMLFHAADLVDGMMGRPGDLYELSHVGYKAQRDEAVRIFSQWKLPLYIPSGNHDGSFNTKLGAGMDIVEDVCSRLEGANYLGINDGDLIINGVTIKLWHGGDGNAYTISYRDQKLIESFTGGEKPNILITGHIHKAYYFFYRNIHTIGAGSMQKQSGWMRAKKLQAHTGFWVVKACLAKGEVKWISPRWYPYYT